MIDAEQLAERVGGAVADVLAHPLAPPGAALAVDLDVERDGGTACAASGWAHLGSREPMTTSTVHDLASVSKVVTTLAVMRLVDTGALSLDDTLGRVLGARGAHAELTIELLLEHRAGLEPWWPLHLAAEGDPIDAVLSVPLATAPGARRYSDLGFQLLGAAVARAAVAPFADAVHDLVLAPAGLHGIRPGPTAETPEGTAAAGSGDDIERRMVATGEPYAVPFDVDDFTGWRHHEIRGETADGTAFHAFRGAAGHAGWFGDPAALLGLARLIARAPEEHGLFRRTTRDRFLQARHDPGQALGLRRHPAGTLHPHRTLWGHPGFTGCAVLCAPEGPEGEGIALALATNRLHGRPAPDRERLAPVDELAHRAVSRLAGDGPDPRRAASDTPGALP